MAGESAAEEPAATTDTADAAGPREEAAPDHAALEHEQRAASAAGAQGEDLTEDELRRARQVDPEY